MQVMLGCFVQVPVLLLELGALSLDGDRVMLRAARALACRGVGGRTACMAPAGAEGKGLSQKRQPARRLASSPARPSPPARFWFWCAPRLRRPWRARLSCHLPIRASCHLAGCSGRITRLLPTCWALRRDILTYDRAHLSRRQGVPCARSRRTSPRPPVPRASPSRSVSELHFTQPTRLHPPATTRLSLACPPNTPQDPLSSLVSAPPSLAVLCTPCHVAAPVACYGPPYPAGRRPLSQVPLRCVSTCDATANEPPRCPRRPMLEP